MKPTAEPGWPERAYRLAAACTCLLAVLTAGPAFAQENPGDELRDEPLYVTYLYGAVEADRTPGNQVSDFEEAELGMALPAGTVVRTDADSLCEVTAPDGSIIKIAGGSVFRLERMLYCQATEEKQGRMELIFGMLWSKVQRLVSERSAFEVVSGTSLAGVRGTSLGVGYDGNETEVLVFEGSVELRSTTGAFEPVTLRRGETSAVHGGAYREPVRRITFAELKAWEQAVGVELPGPDWAAEEGEEDGAGEEPPGGPRDRGARLELSMGSLALEDRVYARLALLPRFSVGRLAATLYLPVIFSPPAGLFDAGSWRNHDHWDFKDLEDGIHDAMTKIQSLEWGDPADPVYLGMGSFSRVTLGHGFIVDRFSNTLGLPLEPRTGLQAVVDAEAVRAHILVADASRFQLLAGRLAAGPFGALPLAFGLTAVHDRPMPESASWPAGATATQDRAQLPRIWVLGADVELPLRGGRGLEAALYADAARIGYTYPELHPDLQGTGYADAGSLELLKGTGLGTGLAGVLGRYSFRLEYRLTFDYYEPGLVGPLWENRRLGYQQELLDLILDQNDAGFDRSLSSGVLLSGGFPLSGGVRLELGYHNYLRSSGVEERRVQGGFALLTCDPGAEGGLTATLGMHRRDNLETLLQDFFDHSTLLEASVRCDVAPTAALALEVKRASLFDDRDGAWTTLESLGVSTVLRF